MSRTSMTSRSTTKSCCNFFFLVTIRNGAFHIVNGAGDTVHTSHDQLSKDHINLSYSIASAADKHSMRQIHGGDVGAGVIRDVLVFNTGRLFSLESIRCHTNVDKQSVTGTMKDSGTEIVFFASKKYDHIVLYQDPIVKQLSLTCFL